MLNQIKTALLIAIPFLGISQNRWTETREIAQARGEVNVVYTPLNYKSFDLDYENIVRDLSDAPKERILGPKKVLQFPDPTGKIIDFKVVYSPVMASEISARYPSIKSYKIISLDKKYVGRIDISPNGFHGIVTSMEGEYYIDPYYLKNNDHYVVYYTRDSGEPKNQFVCGVDHHESHEVHHGHTNSAPRTDLVNFHEFKFAIGCTGEWGKLKGSVENALADINTGVNRVNLIYENEFASRLVIINENDQLIHLDGATDPYVNPREGRKLLGENHAVLMNILGNSSLFDIGHVVTVSCIDGVGGIAALSSACNNGNKGTGVTCAGGQLINEAVRVVAHEVGHQLSAQHTFNVCDPSSDQNAGLNGFEPGSGTTIMSYAGGCGSNNVQGSEDPYYHQGSLDQIYEHTRANNLTCPDVIPTNNHFPTINVITPIDILIPKETPFVLDGEGFDEDGDVLRFNFEEKDASTLLCNLGTPEGSCPQFRSVIPDTFPYRIFPRPTEILAGRNPKDEVLPKYSRDLNFVFTARDNNEEGGIAVWKEFKIKANANAGPFRVISPNLGENYEAGQIIDVTWDVANTDIAPFGYEYVDIYLSTKSALHPSNPNLILLESRVPNTGSAKIQMPNVVSNSVRVMVRAHGGIFFDISNFTFVLKDATLPTAFIAPNKFYEKLCLPTQTSVNFQTTAVGGYNGSVQYFIDNLPHPDMEVAFEKSVTTANEGNNLNINFPNSVPNGFYSLRYYIVLDNNDTLYKKVDFDVTSTDFSSVAALFPVNGEKDAELPIFRWNGSHNAKSYTIEVSKNPLFTVLDATATVTDTFYKPNKTFDKKSVFYWRIRANNDCINGPWSDLKVFGTLTQDCKNYTATGLPLNISQSGQPLISSKINIPSGTNISDVNVTKLKINHNNFADLTGTLLSPSGTTVVLWDKICPKSMNIEVLIDDQAPNPFSCSNTANGQYTSKEKLEKFNGENATGVWQLDIKDNASGNGGKLDIFELEICASVPVQDPFQVNNNLLTILTTEIGQINNDLLSVEDANNTASELIFTITKLPSFGNVVKNGETLQLGGNFTQNDINSGAITYVFTGSQDQSVDDGFNFVVQDNEGGWVGINRFNIRVNSIVSSEDINYNYVINVYPNPANGLINISIVDSPVNFNRANVFNAVGQKIKSQSVTSDRFILDISDLNQGLYIIELTNGVNTVAKRFIAN